MENLGFCIIKTIESSLSERYGKTVGQKFRKDVKRTYGLDRLYGLPEHEQIRWINRYWRQKFSPMADTVELRSWVEDITDTNEYIHLFRTYWMEKVYRTGVYS